LQLPDSSTADKYALSQQALTAAGQDNLATFVAQFEGKKVAMRIRPSEN